MLRNVVMVFLTLYLLSAKAWAVDAPIFFLTGSGNLQTQNYPLENFVGIQANGAFKIKIFPAPQFSVRVTADDNLWPLLSVTQDKNMLMLDLLTLFPVSDVTLQAEIGLPDLQKLGLSHFAQAELQNYTTLARLVVELDAVAQLRSNGGIVGYLQAYLSTASRLHFEHVMVLNAELSLRVASQAELRMNGEGVLIAVLDKASQLNLHGQAGSQAVSVVDINASRFNQLPYPTALVPPVAAFTMQQGNAREVLLDASNSYDTDGNIVMYQWWSSDNQVAKGQQARLQFATDGAYMITLWVLDNHGLARYTQQLYPLQLP